MKMASFRPQNANLHANTCKNVQKANTRPLFSHKGIKKIFRLQLFYILISAFLACSMNYSTITVKIRSSTTLYPSLETSTSNT